MSAMHLWFYFMLQTLTSLGILSALEITLTSDDPQTKAASIDILTYIVEFNPSFVRDYTLQQANTTDEVCGLPTFFITIISALKCCQCLFLMNIKYLVCIKKYQIN